MHRGPYRHLVPSSHRLAAVCPRHRSSAARNLGQSPPPLETLFQTFSPGDDNRKYTALITEEWMQGRTTYGGLSAGICLEAAYRFIGSASCPPLRSAQVMFVGPAGGEAAVSVELVRASKAMSFVRANLSTGGKVATTAVFAFGEGRPSAFDEMNIPVADNLPPPHDCPEFFDDKSDFRPVFTHNFEARLARGGRPFTGSQESDNWLWVRHKGATDDGFVQGPVHSMTALLALADMPPPAITPKFIDAAPIASVSWQVNVLTDAPRSGEGGWWLLRSRAEAARQGYSSQDMTLFGGDGHAAIVGRQSVAIYA